MRTNDLRVPNTATVANAAQVAAQLALLEQLPGAARARELLDGAAGDARPRRIAASPRCGPSLAGSHQRYKLAS
jgi:hypothetical protein